MKKLFLFLFSLGAWCPLYADITGMMTFPYGSDTEIQYNDNGSFGSTTTFTLSDSTMSVPLINTGQGPGELYGMNQDVETTSTVTFASGTITDLNTDNLTVTYGINASTGVFSSTITTPLKVDAGSFVVDAGTQTAPTFRGDNLATNSGVFFTTVTSYGEAIGYASEGVEVMRVDGYGLYMADDRVITMSNYGVLTTDSIESTVPDASYHTGAGDENYPAIVGYDDVSGINFPESTESMEIVMQDDSGYYIAMATFTEAGVDTVNLNLVYGIGASTGVFSGAVTVATLDTGQGANELYDMDQNTLTTSTVTFASMTVTNAVNSAEFKIGANALTTSEFAYLDGQDQSLLTTSSVTFSSMTIANGIVINQSGTDNDTRFEGSGQANALFIEGSNGQVGIATNSITTGMELEVVGEARVTGKLYTPEILPYDFGTDLEFYTTTSGGAGTAGAVKLYGGGSDAGSTRSGVIEVEGGSSTPNPNTHGDIHITGGEYNVPAGNQTGGDVNIYGGKGYDAVGGDVMIYGGDTTVGSDSGDIKLIIPTGASGGYGDILFMFEGSTVTTITDTDATFSSMTVTNQINSASFKIGANDLTASEWANLDGVDQSLITTSTVTFSSMTVTNEINAANIVASSTGTMNYFYMPTGVTNGHVLTTDASGYGTWQAGGGVGDVVLAATQTFTGGNTFNSTFVIENGQSGTTGNIFVGNGAGNAKNTTGEGNVALGFNVLDAVTSGDYNMGLGVEALKGLTTGDNNIGIGDAALYTSTNSIGNIGIGRHAGNLVTGSYNTFIGYNAGATISTGIHNTFFGYGADWAGNPSYKFLVSNSDTGKELIKGDFNTGVVTIPQELEADGGLSATTGIFSDKVSIATTTQVSTFTVNGRIESLVGGIKFPDATIQTTAAGGGDIDRLYSLTASSQAADGTTDSTLATYTLPGGTLVDPGDTLYIYAHGKEVGGVEAKDITIYFGATDVLDMDHTGATNNVNMWVRCVQRAPGNQDCFAHEMYNNNPSTEYTTPSEDETGNIVISYKADEEFTLHMMIVETADAP